MGWLCIDVICSLPHVAVTKVAENVHNSPTGDFAGLNNHYPCFCHEEQMRTVLSFFLSLLLLLLLLIFVVVVVVLFCFCF